MKTSYNLRMEEDLKARLEELAKKDGRSLNNLINKVLCDFVAKRIVERYRKEKETESKKVIRNSMKMELVKKFPKEWYDPSEDGLYEEKDNGKAT